MRRTPLQLARHAVDHSTIGVWLWLVLIVEIAATVFAMDWWLYHHHHKMLTTEFRDALHNEIWGPVITGLTAFVVAAFVWHMYNRIH